MKTRGRVRKRKKTLTRSLQLSRRFPSGNAVHSPASQRGVFNAQRPTLNVQLRGQRRRTGDDAGFSDL
jgi:hypothetical protein